MTGRTRSPGRTRITLRAAAVGLLCATLAGNALAGPREQARRMHERLAGVPPSEQVLTDMQNLIAGGDPQGAADIAMQNKHFYTVTLKNFAAPWTNRAQSEFVPMNDYIAMVIGMIRDDEPFNTLLTADKQWVGLGGVVPAAASSSSNLHYEQLESNNVDLSNPALFDDVPQSSINGLPPAATAGAITTRAAAEAFFIAGTNRAMFRFTLLNHMCNDMEQMHDVSLPPDRIRQDVSRSPGGDSRLFFNNCVGCHTGMDPMAQAFAYYNYDDAAGRIEYTAGSVQPKYFNNDLNFPQGFRTPDDAWDNYWREGQNSYLGFDPGLPGSGAGAKSLGEELAGSQAFASCQVRKVFRAVCLREPDLGDASGTDETAFNNIVSTFRSTGYRMKQVFADTAAHCMGQ